MKEIYELLEPKNYTVLQLRDFKGVHLNYDECVKITQKLVDMELELRKLKSKE
jgi:hypothetical protein